MDLAGRILQKLLLRLADVLYQLLHGLIIHIQGSKGIDQLPSLLMTPSPDLCSISYVTSLIMPSCSYHYVYLMFTLSHFSEFFYDFAIISEIALPPVRVLLPN